MAFGLSHKEGNIALLRLNHLGGQLFSLLCLGQELKITFGYFSLRDFTKSQKLQIDL